MPTQTPAVDPALSTISWFHKLAPAATEFGMGVLSAPPELFVALAVLVLALALLRNPRLFRSWI